MTENAGHGKLRRVAPLLYLALAATLGLQLAFWSCTHAVRLPIGAVDPAPNEAVARIIGLGDAQFYYRASGMWLQNAGSEGGAATPLRKLDYDHLAQWFDLLLAMDARGEYVPVLAGFVFGQTPDPEQARKVARFLRLVALANPERQWRWLAHAIYLARHRVRDVPFALGMARELAALPGSDLPIWTRQMAAFILADTGEKEAARDILEALMASDPHIAPTEMFFMRQYIENKLKPGDPEPK